jgi:hypothetical protein
VPFVRGLAAATRATLFEHARSAATMQASQREGGRRRPWSGAVGRRILEVMRALKPIVGGGVAAFIAFASFPAAAVDNVTLPFTVSPGSFVEVNVTSCPVPETATAVAQLAPQGGAVQVEVSGDAASGGAKLQALLPTDAALGTWTAEASCLDANGDVVDGPVTAEFTVASFQLLTIDPSTGRGGNTVTVSGSGCPTGTTASVFARIEGASDDPVPAFDQENPGTALELESGGSFSGRFTVPADAPEGENRVWVYCVSEGGEPMAGPIVGVFVVDDSLPPTGAVVAPLLLTAVVIIAVGLALQLPARRRG